MKPMSREAGSRTPSRMVRSRLSGRSLVRLLLSASGVFTPSSVGPLPSWWQAAQAPSNMRWAEPSRRPWPAAAVATARCACAPASASSRGRIEGGEIGRHRADVLVGHRAQFAHHLGHRPARDAVSRAVAVAQVAVERIGVPGHGRLREAGECRRLPALDHRARQVGAAALLRTQRIARRVAGAAVAEAVDEVGTAVPFDALLHCPAASAWDRGRARSSRPSAAAVRRGT